MDSWTKSNGILVYNPKRTDVRKVFVHDDWRLVIEVDHGIALYYNWWVERIWGLKLQLPVWKAHITVLNGKQRVEPQFRKAWKAHERERVTFEYNVEFEQHWKFFALPVRCEYLNVLRAELGLPAWDKYHITFGRMF